MSDFMTSAESPAVGGAAAGGMDQITVVRIDDTHIEEERSHGAGKGKAAACYEMEYSVPAEEEEEEEEEDGVYVIEYSNPEEEGESYRFTMSVDRSLPEAKKPAPAPESARAPSPTPTGKPSGGRPRQRRKRLAEEEEVDEDEEARKRRLASDQRVLVDYADYSAYPAASGSEAPELVCTLCPPPGRSFQRASGLAVHMKHMHLLEANKTFFCTMCEQPVRSQVELDAHTKRHANRRAVFTCLICAAAAPPLPGYRGSRLGLRRHLTQQHPGVVPHCDVCRKGFGSVASYLAHQFRHVAVSPYFCPRCQIYEMTERGLTVHIRNDDKKQKKKEEKEEKKLQEKKKEEEKLLRESGGNPQTLDNGDNSATDDSDY